MTGGLPNFRHVSSANGRSETPRTHGSQRRVDLVRQAVRWPRWRRPCCCSRRSRRWSGQGWRSLPGFPCCSPRQAPALGATGTGRADAGRAVRTDRTGRESAGGGDRWGLDGDFSQHRGPLGRSGGAAGSADRPGTRDQGPGPVVADLGAGGGLDGHRVPAADHYSRAPVGDAGNDAS